MESLKQFFEAESEKEALTYLMLSGVASGVAFGILYIIGAIGFII